MSSISGRQPVVTFFDGSKQDQSRWTKFVSGQSLAVVSEFPLESGGVLYNAPIAYKTFGELSPSADNVIVVCHALTGSADIADWWGPLLGGFGRALDTSRFFIICFNCLGSPYGSASPVTHKSGDPSQGHYGPEFPLTTIRDDVNIFKIVLDALQVTQVATVVGGSMGGGTVLEFAFLGRDYVRSIIPIATSARYSAWAISWGEAQRQSIYSDPKYDDGYYSFDDPPTTGLGAARMAALLTYRSRDSFEFRFGRNTPDTSKSQSINDPQQNKHFAIHNDGHRNSGSARPSTADRFATNLGNHAVTRDIPTPTYFSAQSYLRYQGDKFTSRFDANCYIAISRKCDTHDISRHRTEGIGAALAMIQQPALILGIESDGLFTFAEQEELAAGIPNARLRSIHSRDGHDAFLLEFEQVNSHLIDFMKQILPDIMAKNPVQSDKSMGVGGAGMVSEVDDITAW